MSAPPPSTQESNYLRAVSFAIGSTALGLTCGFLVGSYTALRLGLPHSNPTQLQPHILRLTRLLGLAGLVHGTVGGGLMAINGSDEMIARGVAGCAAGASVGITQGSGTMACGLCVAGSLMSMFDHRIKNRNILDTSSYNVLKPVTNKDLE